MKILQVITQSVVGGAQSVVIELSNALAQDGHELIVLSKPDGPMWSSLNQTVKKIECKYFERNIKPIQDLKSYFFIRKILKKEKPDIIHLHTSKVGLLGRLAAWPFNIKKTFYTMHGFDAILKANRKFLPLEKFFKGFCKNVVAVSKYDEDNLKMHGIKNTDVIYNSIKDIKDSPLDTKIEQKIRSLAKNKKIILTIARVSKQKRFESFKELANQMPEHCFIWIGNKNEMPNLPSNLHCLGEINAAGSYIALADIFVLLSNYEGLPVAIIESLACSVPVLASNVGGIPEIIDSTCGYVLDNDSNLFTQKITDLFSNTDVYNAMKKKARLKYEKNFTINTMKDAYLKLFKA